MTAKRARECTSSGSGIPELTTCPKYKLRTLYKLRYNESNNNPPPETENDMGKMKELAIENMHTSVAIERPRYGVGGQVAITAHLTYLFDNGEVDEFDVTFTGTVYGTPGPVFAGTHHVADAGRYGDVFNAEWVRNFYGDLTSVTIL